MKAKGFNIAVECSCHASEQVEIVGSGEEAVESEVPAKRIVGQCFGLFDLACGELGGGECGQCVSLVDAVSVGSSEG